VTSPSAPLAKSTCLFTSRRFTALGRNSAYESSGPESTCVPPSLSLSLSFPLLQRSEGKCLHFVICFPHLLPYPYPFINISSSRLSSCFTSLYQLLIASEVTCWTVEMKRHVPPKRRLTSNGLLAIIRLTRQHSRFV
jgi:hypothetical protein